jgi:hypothetical protein
LTADTAEQFDHRCQTTDLCAGTNDALADRALPGHHQLLRIAASAEITAFCCIQTPVAKSFDTQRSFFWPHDIIRPPTTVVV